MDLLWRGFVKMVMFSGSIILFPNRVLHRACAYGEGICFFQ
jgi:hypothetical protein